MGRCGAPRLSFISLLVAGLSITAVIILVLGWALLETREEARQIAQITTANMANSLADNLKSTIDKIELSLLAIRDEVERLQKPGQGDAQAIVDVIARQDARHLDLHGFRVIAPDGTLKYAVTNVVNHDAAMADRDDFKYLRDTPNAALTVTPPLFGAVSQEWIVGVAMRISNPDGSFGGVVYGALPTANLFRGLAALNLGAGGIVALYHANFQLAARFPVIDGQRDRIGKKTIISDQLRAIMASGVPAAQYEYTSATDGVFRTGFARRVDGAPYYVVVGLAEADYLADWRRRARRLVLFGAFVEALVVTGLLVLHNRVIRMRRLVGSLRDSRERLRQLAVDATLVEERERQAIAADLHDDLGQILHVAGIKLGIIGKALPEGAKAGGLTSELADILELASRKLRSLISQLSPSVLRDMGFVPALHWLADEMARTYGLSVTLEDDAAAKPLSSSQATILFRAVRELLINVHKHADTTEALVRLCVRDGRLHLTVEDSGQGIVDWPIVPPVRKGFGLPSVRERVISFNGTMDIRANPGGGTIVTLVIPFDRQSATILGGRHDHSPDIGR
ncbi:MAG TPA: ATP-binding protein [Telmatospirillum sp.]|nr:ATP-binding protein [Telmatospirillum sp.]